MCRHCWSEQWRNSTTHRVARAFFWFLNRSGIARDESSSREFLQINFGEQTFTGFFQNAHRLALKLLQISCRNKIETLLSLESFEFLILDLRRILSTFLATPVFDGPSRNRVQRNETSQGPARVTSLLRVLLRAQIILITRCARGWQEFRGSHRPEDFRKSRISFESRSSRLRYVTQILISGGETKKRNGS